MDPFLAQQADKQRAEMEYLWKTRLAPGQLSAYGLGHVLPPGDLSSLQMSPMMPPPPPALPSASSYLGSLAAAAAAAATTHASTPSQVKVTSSAVTKETNSPSSSSTASVKPSLYPPVPRSMPSSLASTISTLWPGDQRDAELMRRNPLEAMILQEQFRASYANSLLPDYSFDRSKEKQLFAATFPHLVPQPPPIPRPMHSSLLASTSSPMPGRSSMTSPMTGLGLLPGSSPAIPPPPLIPHGLPRHPPPGGVPKIPR